MAAKEISRISVSDFGWVNRHKFWSCVIGSLIGTYLVSGEPLFLEKAMEFVAPLLRFVAIPFPVFVDMREPESDVGFIREGTLLSDAAAGLPELAALIRLTNDSDLLEVFDSMVDNLPRAVNGTFRDGYFLPHLPMGLVNHSDARQIPFFVGLGLANVLIPREALNFSPDALPRGGPRELTYPLITIFEALRRRGENETVLNAWIDLCLDGKPEVGLVSELRSRESEGIVALALALGGTGDRERLETAIDAVIPDNGVYAGSVTTSLDRTVPSGILGSGFFALWMKAGALLAGQTNPLSNAVFNEAGHILSINPD
jgi:hypothetical protein